jgi:tetratricopeptide (TPR) repeat protein
LLLLTVLIACWVLWESQRLIRSDLGSAQARQKVALWVNRTETPKSVAEWEDARESIESASAIVPDDPAYQEIRGDVYVVAGASTAFSDSQRQDFFKQAIASYREALRLRPTEPSTWASLSAAYFASGDSGPPMQEAWANALALGPYEGHVQPVLMDLALATWAGATPQLQQWVQDTFRDASPRARAQINKLAEARGLRLAAVPADSASAAASGAAP